MVVEGLVWEVAKISKLYHVILKHVQHMEFGDSGKSYQVVNHVAQHAVPEQFLKQESERALVHIMEVVLVLEKVIQRAV